MHKLHFIAISSIVLLIFGLLLGSCNVQPTEVVQKTPSSTKTIENTPIDNNQQKNTSIIIDTLDALIMESFPVQVKAVFSGSFPNGCTQIKEVKTNRNDNVFEIIVVTERTGEICTEVLTPFQHSVDLDVEGLNAGKYIIKLQDKTVEFELSVDNHLSGNNGKDNLKPSPNSTELIEGEIVYIDNVTVTVLKDRKIEVLIQGNLPDGCTKIKDITSELDQEKTIVIQITTERPSQAMCTMALVPFEEIYVIDGKDLPAGTYQLNVIDQNINFTIDN